MATANKGTNRDSFDSRDLIYRAALVELAPRLLPQWEGLTILDQHEDGACTGYGLAATINYLLHRRGQRRRVSPRMLFEMARRYDQWPGNRYDWSSARGAMKGWFKHGVCAEADWPEDDRGGELTAARQKAALAHPLGAYYRILPRRSDVHAALNEAGVVFAAAATHAGWDRPERGVIPFVRAGDAGDTTGHAFAIVGYTEHGFIVQNSWGRDWGGLRLEGRRRPGLALWRYDDFEHNAWDLWVARMALPVESLEALRSGYTLGNQGSRKTQSGPPASEVSGHLIHIDDGGFDTASEYATSAAGAQALLEAKVAAGVAQGSLRLWLHAHGGLNSVDEVARRVRAWRDIVDANGLPHLHWMWETGLLAELKDVVFGKDRFADERAGGAGEWKDRILEKLTRPLGRALWNEMKRDAARAFEPEGAGSRTLQMLAAALAAAPPALPRRLTLSGHSAGAIWVGHLLEAWQRVQPGFALDELVLMAPACRVDFFRAQIAPHLLAGRVARLTLLQLTDGLERDDQVAGVYGKSLLYYVSNACEEPEGGTPLLGMQCFNGRWQDLAAALGPRLRLLTATQDEALCNARSHGAFDDDAPTMNALLAAALGAAPPRPFTADELKA